MINYMTIMAQFFTFIFSVCILTNMAFATPSKEVVGFDPFPKNKGAIYAYDQKDLPKVCFFPVEKARWNGYEVTAEGWQQLTDYQKFKYVEEALPEIELQMDVVINGKVEVPLAMAGLNAGTERLRGTADTKMTPIRLLFETLKYNGQVATKDGKVSESSYK